MLSSRARLNPLRVVDTSGSIAIEKAALHAGTLGRAVREPPGGYARNMDDEPPYEQILEFESVCNRTLQRIAEAILSEIEARYEIGKFVHALRYANARAAGAAPLLMLSERLHLDSSVLRRYARVTEVIRPSELRSFTSLRTPRGLPMTWSHLECLSTVRHLGRRTELTIIAATDELSVRELALRIRADNSPAC